MDQEKIGKFIKEIRLRENLSQQKFAEKFGVTYQAVSKWETGKNIPDITILRMMCKEYNLNLDDFFDAKEIDMKKRKHYIGLVFILIIVFAVSAFFIFKFVKDDDDFTFKTLRANCDNFNLYGSLAYNDNKSSIYISNITYCGDEDEKEYFSIKCLLYEVKGNAKYEISQSNYEDEESISLAEFLKNVNFNVDHYEAACAFYKENSLFLEIEAMSENETITTYKIPLQLDDNC